MNEEKEKRNVTAPPVGWVNELAKLCQCSRATVWNAIRRNAKGDKAEMVRKMYRTKYVLGK
jgi:hypothetical protein